MSQQQIPTAGKALAGKVALITGASRGIGLAIAERFVEEGAQVILVSRKQDQLDDVAAQLRARGATESPRDRRVAETYPTDDG